MGLNGLSKVYRGKKGMEGIEMRGFLNVLLRLQKNAFRVSVWCLNGLGNALQVQIQTTGV